MRRVAAITVVALVGACSTGATGDPGYSRQELIVFGAASLRGVLAAIDAGYAAAEPGIDLAISTDASSALATHILEGAEADVFLAADETAPGRLSEVGLVDGDLIPFASNGLAVIVPAGNPAHVGSAADLAAPDLKVIAAGETVPVTRYAATLIERLAAEPGYPVDFARRYAANVVSREDSVAAVVAKIALGEGDAAIVYSTDAIATDAVERIDVPYAAQVRAAYAGVVLRTSPRLEQARAFMRWLTGSTGQSILARFGFGPAM